MLELNEVTLEDFIEVAKNFSKDTIERRASSVYKEYKFKIKKCYRVLNFI